jgi:GntR family transcriptional regulator
LSEAQLPLYHAIAGLLRNDILTGKRLDGDRVPTIDQLATEFGVARVTIRQAVAVLAEEGLLSVQQGRGTFVTAPTAAPEKVRLESTWQQLLGMLEGNRPEALEVVERTPDLPAVAADGSSTGNYRFMRRLHLQHGQPYCVLDIYLDRDTYLKSPEKFDTEMVIPNLQHIDGLRIRSMRQTFQIATADLTVSRQLGINPNAPVGLVRRVVTDDFGRIIYLGVGRYRGDLVVFETEIEIPPVLEKGGSENSISRGTSTPGESSRAT